MPPTPQTRLIADLTPYEKGVVPSIVQKYVDEIRTCQAAGQQVAATMRPLRILEIDGELLVTDGAHRLKALLDCGETSAPVVIDTKSEYELRPYRRELQNRIAEGLKGGQNLKVCATDKERQKL